MGKPRRVHYINNKEWSHKKWLAFRDRGIGGSEMGPSCGDSLNGDPIKVHMTKIGEPVQPFIGNRYSRFGHYHEEWTIAPLYRHWDHKNPGEEIMLENQEKNLLKNLVRKTYSYIVNDKYPWLFASLDRQIIKDSKGRTGRGFLEAKNTTTFEKNRYTLGFNKDFYLQVMTYFVVGEFDYCDVALHIDGNDYDVVSLEPDKAVQEYLIEKSHNLWKNILEARKVKLEYGIETYYGQHLDFFDAKQKEGIAKLQTLEPNLMGTDNELDMIINLEIPREEDNWFLGEPNLLDLVVEYEKAGLNMKLEGKVQKAVKAKIILALGGYNKAVFPDCDEGYVSFKANKKGVKSLVISDKLKKWINEERLEG